MWKIECGRPINIWISNIAPYLHAVIFFSIIFSLYFLFECLFFSHPWHSFIEERNRTRDWNYSLYQSIFTVFLPAVSTLQACHWLGNLIRCQSKYFCMCLCSWVRIRATWKERSFLFFFSSPLKLTSPIWQVKRQEREKNGYSFDDTKISIKAFSPCHIIATLLFIRNTMNSFHSTIRNSFEPFTFCNHVLK